MSPSETTKRGFWLLALLLLNAAVVTSFPLNVPADTRRKIAATQLRSSLFEEPNDSTLWNQERRQFLQVGGASLATYLLGPGTALAESSVPKTIVVTGSNSGVGFEACKRLAADGSGHTIVLACRTLAKAEAAAAKIESDASSATTLLPAACNLASLESISQFAKTDLPKLLGETRTIDALCLNAGIARNTAATDAARTADGFELTVGTNHFGHFYLNHLLLPSVTPNSGKIVITASSVHDPASPGGAQGVPATLGDLSGLEQQGRACEMLDGGAFNADKAYKDSKLCNVLFTRELSRRLDASSKGITANCFSPGLIVGTGLFRDQNPFFTKLFDVAATDLLKVGETPPWGGGCLAYMVNAVQDTRGSFYDSPPGSSKYGDAAFGNQFAPSQVSVEAQDNAKAKKLWELSERELGLA